MNNHTLFSEITTALHKVKAHLGTEIFASPSRFTAAINDLVDSDAKTVKHLLRIAICDLQAYSKLREAYANGNFFVAKHLKNEMTNDYMIPPEISQGVIECIVVFMGFPSSPEISNQPKSIPDHIVSTLKPRPVMRTAINTPPPAIASVLLQPQQPNTSANIPRYIAPLPPKVGDMIRFGQRNWRILEIIGKNALILSNMIIETRHYHEKDTGTDWASCSLRKHLNGHFFNAFDSYDRTRIIPTLLRNPKNPWFGTKGGSDTSDKIFLLNIEEAVRYFGDSGSLRKKPSSAGHLDDQYSQFRQAKNNMGVGGWWWLRAPGFSTNRAAFVSAAGALYIYGGLVRGGSSGGVRPAMWITI